MGKMGILAWTMGSIRDIITTLVSVDGGPRISILLGRLLEPYEARCVEHDVYTRGSGTAERASIVL